jgi:hypothetical protein
MAAQAKGTGRAKGPRGPAKPKAPTAAQERATFRTSATPQAKTTPTPPGVPAPRAAAARPERRSPAALRVAAAAQVAEAVGLFVAGVFGAISTADGKSYQLASGVVLTVIAFGTAAALVCVAAGLAKAEPWSRIPAAITQLFVVMGGITLLDGHRPEWGVPALVLAATCVAGLLTPASLRALNRPPAESVKSD